MKRLVAILLLAATPAFGHARLTDSIPTAGAKVKSPNVITLHFSEKLEPAFSGAGLSDDKGHALRVPASVGATAISLVPLQLKPGNYQVQWHSVGQDTHRLSGSFGFTVVP